MATPTVEVWSKTPASNSSADSQINMAEGMDPGDVNDGVRALMAAVANMLDDQGGQKSLAGGTTAYTFTPNGDQAVLADGLRCHAVVNSTNTGASTLNYNAKGAKNIYKAQTSGIIAIAAGDMVTDQHCIFEYDASLNGAVGGWMLLNPAIAVSGATAAPTDATYVTLSTNATLTVERVLTAGTSVALVDAGAGSTLTIQRAALTGDVTATTDSNATTIATDVVSNTKLANMVASTIKGRVTGSTGDPEDMTFAQLLTMITGLTAMSAGGVAVGDTLPIYDLSATTAKSITVTELLKAVNALTEDTSPSASADFLLSYDTSASTVKKVKPGNLPSSLPDPVYATYTTNAAITTVIPNDDTLPQITEGTEIISQAFTPSSTTGRVRVTFSGYFQPASPISAVAALFNGGSDALQVGMSSTDSAGSTRGNMISFSYEYTPASVSAITFSVRVGPLTAGTIRLNGNGSGRLFGGAMAATLVVQQITP